MSNSTSSSLAITPPIHGADFLEDEPYSYRYDQVPPASSRDIKELLRAEEGFLENASFSTIVSYMWYYIFDRIIVLHDLQHIF
ncbi:hypothetical protein AYI69_g9135 [Smittium culicis]|uniref:Uncharacterized protein n=1 Tax=Smittium culicis TaxID=133412 RepID=A0A1R1XEP9_9FUNG|nr:hypothetical protein AYI69_g9135 [Smittium culicis]